MLKTPGQSFKDFFSPKDDSPYLKGKLLISMPQMHDPRFERAVIFVCAHDQNGAMGIMINQKKTTVSVQELCGQMDFDWKEGDTEFAVYNGGPVDTSRGFILHSTDFNMLETVAVDQRFAVTGTIDALRLIIKGDAIPRHMLFALGYTGWSEGQLEEELANNAWLVTKANQDLVFKTPVIKIWDEAIRSLGVEPAMLSGDAGRA